MQIKYREASIVLSSISKWIRFYFLIVKDDQSFGIFFVMNEFENAVADSQQEPDSDRSN